MSSTSRISAPFPEACDPPEVDLYGLAHKGLRWGLSEVLCRLGTATADPAELAPLLDDLEGLLYLCERHAHHEDLVYHPALEACREEGARELDREHHALEVSVAELRALSVWLARAPADRRPAILRTLYLRFGAFAAENLAHMNHEETYAQPLLSATFTRDELLALHARLLAGVGPEERLAFYRLTFPAMSPPERRMQLARIAEAAPREVVSRLIAELAGVLRPADHRDLMEALAAE